LNKACPAAADHRFRSLLQDAARREPPVVGERVRGGPADPLLKFKTVQILAHGALLELKVAAFPLQENLPRSWTIPSEWLRVPPLPTTHIDDIELPVDRRDPALDCALAALQPARSLAIVSLGVDNGVPLGPRGTSFRRG
jgi:hypothetical protein